MYRAGHLRFPTFCSLDTEVGRDGVALSKATLRKNELGVVTTKRSHRHTAALDSTTEFSDCHAECVDLDAMEEAARDGEYHLVEAYFDDMFSFGNFSRFSEYAWMSKELKMKIVKKMCSEGIGVDGDQLEVGQASGAARREPPPLVESPAHSRRRVRRAARARAASLSAYPVSPRGGADGDRRRLGPREGRTKRPSPTMRQPATRRAWGGARGAHTTAIAIASLSRLTRLSHGRCRRRRVVETNHTPKQAGSPIDPTFWPIHPTVERLWAHKKLKHMMGDEQWPDGHGPLHRMNSMYENCTGHAPDDLVPFHFSLQVRAAARRAPLSLARRAPQRRRTVRLFRERRRVATRRGAPLVARPSRGARPSLTSRPTTPARRRRALRGAARLIACRGARSDDERRRRDDQHVRVEALHER